MLLNLHIKNVALIDESNISFHEGLNVLSGETGAGKSIIFDSISFVFGARSDKTLIRNGASCMKVEALFVLDKPYIELLQSFGIEMEDENLLITRTLNLDSKSEIRINGNIGTVSILKKISDLLLDITAQSENLSIMKPSNYLGFIDEFKSEKITPILNEYKVLKTKYDDIYKEIEKYSVDGESKIDYLTFQIDEIEALNLKPDEDITLMDKKNKMQNSEKIVSLLNSIHNSFDDENENIINKLNYIIRDLNTLSMIEEKYLELSNRITSVKLELEDVFETISSNKENYNFSEDEYNELENRIDLINGLKRKHNVSSVLELLDKLNDMKKERANLENSEEILNGLQKQKYVLFEKLENCSLKLTKERKLSAEELCKKILSELNDLEMKNCKLQVEFDKKSEYSNTGCDEVQFMFSANSGEELKPIYKVISGGEMSRFYLAFKNVLNHSFALNKTLIFDEIDAGISGVVGLKMAQKLKKISNNSQIICISHLPQICAIANFNYLIEKFEENGKTFTSIKELNYKEKISEITRLSGGVLNTDISIKHAEELIELLNK